MLEEILDAQNVEEIMIAMERRIEKGFKYDDLKPKPMKKMIMELNKELIE